MDTMKKKYEILEFAFSQAMYSISKMTTDEWYKQGTMDFLIQKDKKIFLNDYYPFIPNETNKIVNQLMFVLKTLREEDGDTGEFPKKHYKFLDVGCGIGNVMLLAKATGFRQAHGIEFDKSHAKRFLYGTSIRQTGSEVQVFWQDARTFEDYDQYDVVYMYRPIANHNMQGQLERRVASRMKKGAFFLANLCNRRWGNTKMKCIHTQDFMEFGEIWRKV